MTNYITFGISLTIVISITVGMVRYFIVSLKKAFPVLALHPFILNILYLPVPLAFFLFHDRSLKGSVHQTFFSYALYVYFTFLFVFTIYGLFFELMIFLRRRDFRKRRVMFIILSLISSYTVAAGSYLANDIRVEELDIHSAKITRPVRIVQLTDIHFSSMVGTGFAEKIRDITNSLRPDTVIVTGDFIDHWIEEPEKISEIMRSINAPLGKFAISGNHEFINGFENAVEYIKWSGFAFLYTGNTGLNDEVSLVSVTDKTADRFGLEVPDDIETLQKAVNSKFVIFLKHQPSVKEGAEEYFDLMLSGHTHAGQLFPFHFFVRAAFHYFSGTYRFENGSVLHVNRGTGTWGPAVRFGSMPEITLIRLLPENIEK